MLKEIKRMIDLTEFLNEIDNIIGDIKKQDNKSAKKDGEMVNILKQENEILKKRLAHLAKEHEELVKEYEDLEQDFADLSSDYLELEDRFDALQEDYKELENTQIESSCEDCEENSVDKDEAFALLKDFLLEAEKERCKSLRTILGEIGKYFDQEVAKE